MHAYLGFHAGDKPYKSKICAWFRSKLTGVAVLKRFYKAKKV